MFFTFVATLLQIWLKMSAEKKWQIAPVVLRYTDLASIITSTYWRRFLTWINSLGLVTIPVKPADEANSEEYESFQEPDAKNKIDGRVVLVNGVLRKVCIVVYILLVVSLSFLVFF
jgi:hypothetical protein